MDRPPAEQRGDLPRVLSGIRVLDFGRVLAAPHCAQLMCDMGAEVIKIERPEYGDDTRMDPYVYEPGLSAAFMQQNWGKKSLSIDLRHPEAREIVYRLVEKSDVVVENFRPGVMDRLGLGYERLASMNPRIIFCSISAYGQTGPYAHAPGYGPIAEAIAGIPELTGEPDGPPMPTFVPIADNVGALLALGAINAALYHRERTGAGQAIDISLLDAAFQMHDMAVQQFLASNGQVRVTRRGLRDTTWVPWGNYEGRDGWVTIMVGNEAIWPRLAESMGRPEMATDPRFDTFEHRYQNREEVYRLVEEWVRSLPSVDRVVEILNEAGVPSARVNDIEEAINHPQVRARDMLVERQHPTLGPMLVMNSGVNFSRSAADVTGYPPFLGEHNREILTGLLGLEDGEVDRLTQQGVLYRDPRADAASGGRK